MATKTDSPPAVEPRPQMRLRAVNMSGSPALGVGNPISLKIEPERTVLVGRNGAGKSAIIEAMYLGFRYPMVARQAGPSSFHVMLEGDDGRQLHYSYQWVSEIQKLATADPDSLLPKRRWSEKCWWGSEKTQPVWDLQDGKLILVGDSQSPLSLPLGTSLLQLGFEVGGVERVHEEIGILSALCRSTRIGAGVPREEQNRSDVLFRLRKLEGRQYWMAVGPSQHRLSVPLLRIMRWFDFDKDQFKHFEDLGKLLGVFEKVEVETYKISAGSSDSGELGALLFDKVNAGLLADGTLRMIETLVSLISRAPGTILLIEEPETAIHPGILTKLLSVIESYSHDRQVVYSTHSPLVVSHAKPREMRLVERRNRATHVRNLSTEESGNVVKYLEDHGNLGEFVFSGGIDDGA